MNVRSISLVAVVVVACLVAWAAGMFTVSAFEPVGAPSRDGAVPAAAAASDTSASGEPIVSPADDRTAVAERGDARRARITTVDPDGQPIAGAEVLYWPPRSDEERQREQQRVEGEVDIESRLRASGRIAITGVDGTVEIDADPWADGCARLGEVYGEFALSAFLPMDSRDMCDVRVELRHDLTLRVEVVDSAGKPVAGRMVGVAASGMSRRRGIAYRSEDIGPTDADGVAVLPHLLHQLELDEDVVGGTLQILTSRRTDDASVDVLAERRVPLTELRRKTTIRLEIPAGGIIVVNTKDAAGAPFNPAVWLRDEQGEMFDCSPLSRDGEHTFLNVPCGRRWEVTASDGGMVVGVVDDITVAVVGPRSEDEIVPVAVQLPLRKWRMTMRIMRSDGSPLARVKVRCTCVALGWDGELTTDDGGSLLLWGKGKAAVNDAAPLELRIETPLARPRALVFDRPLPPGEHDLGDIVVEPPDGETLLARVELRAGGEVLGDDARVELLWHDGERNEPVPVLRRRVTGAWELRGLPPHGPMQLRCWHPKFLSPPLQSLRVGEHRVIELQPAASLRLAIVAPDVPLGEVRGALTPLGGDASDHEGLDVEQQTVRWAALVPGRYGLRLEIAGRVLYEAPLLDLRAGENRWPADGSRLDLRGKANAICIAARSRRDGSSARTELLVIEPDATALPPDWKEHSVDSGWVFESQRPRDVLVREWQHVPVRLGNPTHDVVVELEPCTQIDLEATPPADEVRVCVVTDAVTDALLRAFDEHHEHMPERMFKSDPDLWFAPGSVVEITALRAGKPGVTQRFVVGTASPQQVTLR